MMRRGIGLLMILAATACTEREPEAPQVSEAAAAAVVRALYPGINAPPVANCVVNNASQAEIDGLAITTSAGSETRFAIVRAVLARPETQSCIAQNNVSFPT